MCACGFWTHRQKPLICAVLSCAGSDVADCYWSAAPGFGAPGSAAQRGAARPGSTSWTGSERRTPLWPTPLMEATGSCCWSLEMCKPPAGAASTRRSRCPAGWQNQGRAFTCIFSYLRKGWSHMSFTVIYLEIIVMWICRKKEQMVKNREQGQNPSNPNWNNYIKPLTS